VSKVSATFPGSAHVGALGLDTATDRAIWAYAQEQGLVIVSKDSYFRQLLTRSADAIVDFGQAEDEALLVLPDLSG
jgi:predicted nuclease of predicted toxin-antitoxin system